METKKEEQKAMLVSAAAKNEPYTSTHTGAEIDEGVSKALDMDLTKYATTQKLETGLADKVNVSDIATEAEVKEMLDRVFQDFQEFNGG